ncbi:MAG: response regulator [Candidatus Eremiobacteraeota bacterium]|nr:response regulator [Candidatus Eremiobacteraeota bacterium]
MSDQLGLRLLEAFRSEYGDYLKVLRAGFRRALDEPSETGLEEMLRACHTLKGAARAAAVAPVERAAHRLETVLSRLSTGRQTLHEESLESIEECLDRIEDYVNSLREPDPESSLSLDGSLAVLLGEGPPPTAEEPAAPAASPFPGPDRTDSRALDELLSSLAELVAISSSHETLCSELRHIEEGLTGLETVDSRGHERALFEIAAKLRETRARMRDNSQRLARGTLTLERAVARVRLIEAGSVLSGFGPSLRAQARAQGKKLRYREVGLEILADKTVLERLRPGVMHLLRNCVHHGLETPEQRAQAGKSGTGTVELRLALEGGKLRLEVCDDGRGLSLAQIRARAIQLGLMSADEARDCPPERLHQLLFRTGFSTETKVDHYAGRGLGLAVLSEVIQSLSGEVELESEEDLGATVRLELPVSVSSQDLLLVSCNGQVYGLAAHLIERLSMIEPDQLEESGDGQIVRLDDETFPAAGLGALLGQSVSLGDGQALPLVVVRTPLGQAALLVDQLLWHSRAMVRPLSLPGVSTELFAGVWPLADGRLALVLKLGTLVERIQKAGPIHFSQPVEEAEVGPRVILVVDDSLTTRAMERSILEAEGYLVLVAVDGPDALEQLSLNQVDLIVSDVEMPGMTGFELLERVRSSGPNRELPFILLTSRSDPVDQRRGLELGAQAYLVKQRFQQEELLETVRQLL